MRTSPSSSFNPVDSEPSWVSPTNSQPSKPLSQLDLSILRRRASLSCGPSKTTSRCLNWPSVCRCTSRFKKKTGKLTNRNLPSRGNWCEESTATPNCHSRHCCHNLLHIRGFNIPHLHTIPLISVERERPELRKGLLSLKEPWPSARMDPWPDSIFHSQKLLPSCPICLSPIFMR